MSISCDCSRDDGDLPEFYREETPIARKVHVCCECGGNIEPGQKYHKAVGVWEGEFKAYHTCWPCESIRANYCPGGFVFGGLAETINNCFGFDYRKVPRTAE